MRVFLTLIGVMTLLSGSCQKRDTGGMTPVVQAQKESQFINLAYGSLSQAQKLDLFLPSVGVAPYPVVVWIHGGGWVNGDKTQFVNPAILTELRARGYAVASINYRLSGEAKFPAQINDVKAAVRWLKANATTYSLRSTKFGVWGSSAGGHLAALAGTSGGVAELENLTLGNSTYSSAVQVVIDWFGPTDFMKMDSMTAAQKCAPFNHNSPGSPESALIGYAITTRPDLVAKANPITYISVDDPPFFVNHGLIDCTVPYGQSQLLYDKLVPVLGTQKVKLKLLPSSGHGGGGFDNIATVKESIDFLDAYLK